MTMLATRESDPSAQEAVSLFEALEKRFPAANLGNDKWYLIAVSIVTFSSSTYHRQCLSIGFCALRQPQP